MKRKTTKATSSRLTSAQLKLLDSLPEMLEALAILSAQYEEIRRLTSASGSHATQRPVMGASAIPHAPMPLPPPAAIVLDTPERREYLESLRAGVTVPAPFEAPPVVGEAQTQRQAAQRAFLANLSGRKSELLGQFTHDGGGDDGAKQ